jgi:YgiT-type zinc finger domain-containing protein
VYYGSAEAYHHYSLFAQAAEMDFADATETRTMKCSIEGCPGEYELKTVIHTVRKDGRVIVIDHVPAEVCSACGDVLFSPQTVRHIEHLLENLGAPSKSVPLFEYA